MWGSSLGWLSKQNMLLSRGLIMPNTLPREGGAIMRYKDVIERSNVKLPPYIYIYIYMLWLKKSFGITPRGWPKWWRPWS